MPSKTYDAKKMICPLGLEVQKINACKEDCMLYIGDYANLTECHFCGTPCYKRFKHLKKEDYEAFVKLKSSEEFQSTSVKFKGVYV